MKSRALMTVAAIAVAVLFITNAAQAQISRHFPDPLTVSTATISVLYATNTYIPQGSCHFFDSGTDTVKTCYDGTYLYSSGAEYKVDTLTSLGLATMASGTFGGGYGSTGATLNSAGDAWFNGNVTVDGSLTFGAVSVTNLTASGYVAASSSMYIDQSDFYFMGAESISYDGSDINLSADTAVAGNIVATGYASATNLHLSGIERITSAGVSAFASETIGGGYGSTGASFTPTGDGWFNGDLTVDGALSSGAITASSIQASGFVAASDSMYVDQSDFYYMGTESIAYDGTGIKLSTDTDVAGDLTATGYASSANLYISGVEVINSSRDGSFTDLDASGYASATNLYISGSEVLDSSQNASVSNMTASGYASSANVYVSGVERVTAAGEGIFASSSIGGGCWGTGTCLEADGDIYADGDVTANAFVGDGSGLTSVPADTLQEVATAGATTTTALAAGGGYGSTGCSITTDGDFLCDGDITSNAFIGDGSGLTSVPADTLQQVATAGATTTTALAAGGGYGSTGCSLTDAGVIYCDGDITASAYHGDGSALTGVAPTLQEVTTAGDTTTDDIITGGLAIGVGDFLYFDGPVNGVAFRVNPTNDVLNASAAIKLSSSNDFGIALEIDTGASQQAIVVNDTSSARMLEIRNAGTGDTAYFVGQDTGEVILARSSGIPSNGIVQIDSTGGSASSKMLFLHSDGPLGYHIYAESDIDGTDDREVFMLTDDGRIALGVDITPNLVDTYTVFASGTIATNDSITASGTVTAESGLIIGNETMDTYDEGTWTIVATGTAGIADCTNVITESGFYTVIGDTVHAYGNVSMGAGCTTAPTGTPMFSLPFTTTSEANFVSVCNVYLDAYALTAGSVQQGVLISNNGYMYLYETVSGSSAGAPIDDDGYTLYFECTHKK